MNALRIVVLIVLIAARAGGAQTVDWRAHAGYFGQNTRLGDSGVTTTSWAMLHAGAFSAMVSPDPLINGECGQPRLMPGTFDCGDARSMSHTLIMGLEFAPAFGAFRLRMAVVGEPAFGPQPYFMRRSALDDPGEPLAHMLFTPSHSAHGVLTGEYRFNRFTLEASAFNPNHVADRYEIDLGPLKATAARFTLRVAERVAIQASAAWFPAAEDGSGHGHAGSAMGAYSLTATGSLANAEYTIGCVAHRISGLTPGACMLEGVVSNTKHRLFGRVELINRLQQNMVAEILPDGSHFHTIDNKISKAGEVALGYALQLAAIAGLQTSLGARAALTLIPDYFRQRYLEDRAATFTIFASARPAHSLHH